MKLLNFKDLKVKVIPKGYVTREDYKDLHFYRVEVVINKLTDAIVSLNNGIAFIPYQLMKMDYYARNLYTVPFYTNGKNLVLINHDEYIYLPCCVERKTIRGLSNFAFILRTTSTGKLQNITRSPEMKKLLTIKDDGLLSATLEIDIPLYDYYTFDYSEWRDNKQNDTIKVKYSNTRPEGELFFVMANSAGTYVDYFNYDLIRTFSIFSDTFKPQKENVFPPIEDVEGIVWNGLLDYGLNGIQASGVMGNIKGESNFDPTAVEKGSGEGFGLCQWSFDRKQKLFDLAASRGISPEDVYLQVEYLCSELGPENFNDYHTGRDNYADWINATNPDDACAAFMWGWERPNSLAGTDSLDYRKYHARKYYEKYGEGKQPIAKGRDLEKCSIIVKFEKPDDIGFMKAHAKPSIIKYKYPYSANTYAGIINFPLPGYAYLYRDVLFTQTEALGNYEKISEGRVPNSGMTISGIINQPFLDTPTWGIGLGVKIYENNFPSVIHFTLNELLGQVKLDDDRCLEDYNVDDEDEIKQNFLFTNKYYYTPADYIMFGEGARNATIKTIIHNNVLSILGILPSYGSTWTL